MATALTGIVVATFVTTWLFAVLYDRTPAHFDSATNFLRAMNIREFIRAGDLDRTMRWYWYYPNGESWIVNASFALFGATYRASVLSNAIWIAALVRGLLLLARRTTLTANGRLVLISIVLGAPVVIGSTHELILDLPMLALFVALLVSLRGIPTRPHLSAWVRPATAAGCCLLIKWSSLPWMLCAVGVELYFRWRRHQRLAESDGVRPATVRTYVSFGAVFIACLWWYGGNHTALLHDIVTKGINAGIVEGDPQGVGLASLRFYLTAFVRSYAWLPMTIALMGLVVVALRRLRPHTATSHTATSPTATSPTATSPSRHSWITTAILGIGAPNLLFLLWQSNKDARYAMPMIVLLGLAAGRAIDRIAPAAPRRYVVVFAMIALVNITSLNGPWGTGSVSWNSLPIVGAAGYTAPRPNSERPIYDEVVAEVERRREQLGCTRSFVVRDEILGVWINHRTMAARLVEKGWAWVDPGQGCVGLIITAPGGSPVPGAAAVGVSAANQRAFPSPAGTIWVVSPRRS